MAGGDEFVKGQKLKVSKKGIEKCQEVEEFKYIGTQVEGKGRIEREIKNTVVEEMKVTGRLREVWK